MHDTAIGLLINKVVVNEIFMLNYRFHPLALSDYLLSNSALTAHGINRHNTVLEHQAVEQFRNSDNFIRFTVYFTLPNGSSLAE